MMQVFEAYSKFIGMIRLVLEHITARARVWSMTLHGPLDYELKKAGAFGV